MSCFDINKLIHANIYKRTDRTFKPFVRVLTLLQKIFQICVFLGEFNDVRRLMRALFFAVKENLLLENWVFIPNDFLNQVYILVLTNVLHLYFIATGMIPIIHN